MRKKTAFCLLVVLVWFVPPLLQAQQNHYIRSGATGAQNGADWANAFLSLPATLIRGDTYYIADGSYGAYTFNDTASGSQVITIKKATATDHGTNTGWNSSYGDGTATFIGTIEFTTAYHVFDGQRRNADWKSGYGFKIISGQTKGIRLSTAGANHNTVRYVEIEGVGDDGDGSPSNDHVYITRSGDHFKIQYSYLHDAGRAPFLLREADDGLIEYCYIARNESTSGQHSEGISASNRTDRWIVRLNIWEEIEGTGFIVFRGDGWELYGNLFFDCSGNNGGITTWSTDPDQASVTNAKVINNTFVDCIGINQGTSFDKVGATPIGNVHYNNIYYNCANVIINGTTSEYNVYESSEGESNEQILAGNPFVDYANNNFTLSSATQAGMIPTLDIETDLIGLQRGADAVWDRGAFEYSASGGGGGSPGSPSGLRLMN